MTGMSKQIGGIEPRNYRGRTIGWTAYYANPIDGGRVRRYFHDRDDAQDWLDGERLLVKAHKRGRKQWTHPRDRERKEKGATMPFKDFAEEWFDKRGRFDRHDPTRPLAPNTLRHKRLQLDRVERTFGNTPLGDITERMVADWLRDLDLDPIPKRETFIMLRAVMQAAAHPTDDRPLIDHNPCTQPVPPKPRSKRETIPELTPQQIAAVRDHMPDYTRVSINVMLGLGLRIGEMCALRVGDLDLEHGICHLTHSIRRGDGDIGDLVLGDMKTGTSRQDVPIPDRLIPELEKHIERYSGGSPDAMLLHPERTSIMSDRTLRAQISKALAAAGRADATPHLLRATAVSMIIHQGGELKDAQLFARHSDPTITARFYEKTRGLEHRRTLANLSYGTMFAGARTLEELERDLMEAERQASEWSARVIELRRLVDLKRRG